MTETFILCNLRKGLAKHMGFWEFWKRRKERERNLAEASSIDTVGATQKSDIEEPVTAQNQKNEDNVDDVHMDGVFRFDRGRHKPVIRSSICTGEQVAGFKDRRTGRFMEIMLIRDNGDIEAFTREYGISREEITREW